MSAEDECYNGFSPEELIPQPFGEDSLTELEDSGEGTLEKPAKKKVNKG